MKRAKGRIFIGIVGCALLGAIVWAFLPKPVPCDLSSVVRGPLQVTVDQDGKTRIKERYTVSSPLAGELRRIELKEGDAVEAGKTVLAVIEPGAPALLDVRTLAQAEARVKAAEAGKQQAVHNLERLRATEELARSEYSRTTELRKQGVASPQELDAAREKERAASQAVSAAKFAQQIAEFELEQAQAALIGLQSHPAEPDAQAEYKIVSPINGRVLRVLQKSEMTVTPGLPLLELGDPANLEIVIDVLSSDAVKIHPGARVRLERWGGDEPLTARVRRVEPAAYLKVSALGVEEQRVDVVADLVDPPEARSTLGDRYRVEARIVIWEADDVLKVPASALFRRGDEWTVFREVNGRARLKLVKIGHSNGLESEVLGGLEEGDRVVLYPSDRIKDGARVEER